MLIKRLRVVYNFVIKMEKEKHQIHLTSDEKLIFKTLKTYQSELGLNTIMRVAGGWVRDKLMNKESHDIDIALDNMKGQDFVKQLKSYSENKGQKISSFGVTKFNPELSKHLQTATARIHGYAIDFVNLRSQKYSQESRIPIIDIGTPLQDALRRDFTINSLFYNINTQEIQDWTQLGISDIQNRILRTPLAPYQTFKDDPLRVLRCFRFMSRFDFTIHEQIYKALQSKDIHQSLRTKVSKQRIGIQLSGILKSHHPLKAFEQIKNYEYWNIIFSIPGESDLNNINIINKIPSQSFQILRRVILSMQTHKWQSYEELIEQTKDKKTQMIDQLNSKHTQANKKDEQRMDKQSLNNNIKTQNNAKAQNKNAQTQYKNGQKQKLKQKKAKDTKKKQIRYPEQELKIMVPLASLVVTYRHYRVKDQKNKFQSLVSHIIKCQLKYSSKVAKFVQGVCAAILDLEDLLLKELTKIHIANWLRLAEQKWELALHILSVIVQLEDRKYNIKPLKMRQIIYADKLQNTYLVEPLIDGTFLTKRGIKGPMVKVVLDNATIWRVLNPTAEKVQFLELFQKNQQFFKDQNSYK